MRQGCDGYGGFMPPSLTSTFGIGLFLLLCLPLSVTGTPTPDSPAGGELSDLLEFIQEEQSLQPFDLGEFLPPISQPLGPTTTVFEVSAQDILDQNARSVADALRFVPGLFLSIGGNKNPSLASVRGLNTGQNVVFIDGRPVYDPFFGDVDLRNLPVDNIATIKIIKGPVDPAYGPNAFGTVFNIITKKGTKTPTTRINSSYEGANTHDYWVEHGGQKESFNYYVTGSYRRSNGFDLANNFSTMPVQQDGFRQHAGFEKWNVSANLGYDFTAHDKIALLVGYYKADMDNPVNVNQDTLARRGIPYTSFSDWNRWYADLHGQTTLWKNLELRGNAYFDRFQNDLVIFTDNAFSQIDDISKDTNDVIGTNLQAALPLTDRIKVKAGLFVKHDKHERKSADSRRTIDTLTTGYFGEVEYMPLPNLQTNLGFGYDLLYTGGGRSIPSPTWRWALIYQPWERTRLHTAIGRKSRLPRLINLHAGIGNLDLVPETNFSVEIGGTQRLWNDRMEIGLRWFRNDVDETIDFVRLPGPGNPTQDQNLLKAISQGMEVSLMNKLTDEWSVSLDYTYTDVVVTSKNDERFSRFYHQVNARVAYVSSWGLNGFVQASYFDGEPTSSPIDSFTGQPNFINFFLLNGKVSYQIAQGIRPFLAVENLADANYARHLGFPEPGRRFFVGVHAQF